MSARVNLADIPADVRQALGLEAPTRNGKRRTLTKNDVRTYAIRVLAVVATLTPQERRRVLVLAGRMNDV